MHARRVNRRLQARGASQTARGLDARRSDVGPWAEPSFRDNRPSGQRGREGLTAQAMSARGYPDCGSTLYVVPVVAGCETVPDVIAPITAPVTAPFSRTELVVPRIVLITNDSLHGQRVLHALWSRGIMLDA